MSNEAVVIQEIDKNNIKSIVSLADELGYQIQTETVGLLIDSILEDKKQWAFIAVKENEVLGFIHAIYALRLTSPPFIEITGLVVSEKERSKGIGKQLLQHIEQNVAKDLKIRVRCNSKRVDAHRFYLNNAFHKQKEQFLFVK